MDQISFQGNFLKKVNIKKLTPKGEYRPVCANFVELDHNDAGVVRQISKDWKTSKINFLFGTNEHVLLPPDVMKRRMDQYLPLTKNMKKDEIPAFLSSKLLGPHVYVVTSQKNRFSKMEPDKILGVVEFNVQTHKTEITTLQTRPDCVSKDYGNQSLLLLKRAFCSLFGIKDKSPKRPYGNIGSSIIKTLQEMHSDKPMELIPLNPAKSFYRKHGFQLNTQNYFEYVWDPTNKLYL